MNKIFMGSLALGLALVMTADADAGRRHRGHSGHAKFSHGGKFKKSRFSVHVGHKQFRHHKHKRYWGKRTHFVKRPVRKLYRYDHCCDWWKPTYSDYYGCKVYYDPYFRCYYRYCDGHYILCKHHP